MRVTTAMIVATASELSHYLLATGLSHYLLVSHKSSENTRTVFHAENHHKCLSDKWDYHSRAGAAVALLSYFRARNQSGDCLAIHHTRLEELGLKVPRRMHADAMSSRASFSRIAFKASIVQTCSEGEEGAAAGAAGAPT